MFGIGRTYTAVEANVPEDGVKVITEDAPIQEV